MDQNPPPPPPAPGSTPPLNPMQPTNPSSLPNTPPAPPVPEGLPPIQVATPNVTQVPEGGGSKKTMMMIVIVILVVAILGVGGFMVYQMQMGASKPTEEVMTENKTTDSPGVSELKTEIDSIEVTSPEQEFVEVDKEITALDASPLPSTKASASPKASPKASAKASTTP